MATSAGRSHNAGSALEHSGLDPSVEADRQRWDAVLSGCRHDFHHLPAYLELEAARLGGRGLGLLVEGREGAALLPLVVRAIPGQAGYDAMSPYGYPGPVFTRSEPGFLDAASEALVEGMRARELVSAFLRLHPLLPVPSASLERHGQLLTHGPTVWIDLEAEEAAQWGAYRSTHRNLVRRAKREGLTVHFDEDFTRLDGFYQVYAQTLDRLGADESGMGRAYLEQLAQVLRGRGFLALVEHQGELIAGGIFSRCSGIVQYHLSGTASAWRKASPSRLMLDEVRRRQASAGDWRMHLGGGVGAQEDALFKFKRGFSSSRGQFQSCRLIVDKDAYARLLADWEARGGDASLTDDFFPRYRSTPCNES